MTAIHNGVALLTWELDSFAIADSDDEVDKRLRGLGAGEHLSFLDGNAPDVLVKASVAKQQLDRERIPEPGPGPEPSLGPGPGPGPVLPPPSPDPARRYHGTVVLDTARVGRDAGQIAEEVISHLSGLVGSTVRVALEIEADVPSGVTEQVVRIVTENARQLGFTNQGFERE